MAGHGLPARIPPPDCLPRRVASGRESGMIPCVSLQSGGTRRHVFKHAFGIMGDALDEAFTPGDDPNPQPPPE